MPIIVDTRNRIVRNEEALQLLRILGGLIKDVEKK